MQTLFITGCGSGFGRRTTEQALQRGHRVIATDLDPTTLATLDGPADQLLRLPLDVRDPVQIQAAVDASLAWHPPTVLVNNAGVAAFGAQEHLPADAIRHMFDVNVFGLIEVTRAWLPTLRANGGTVVQLSSVAGRTVFPESGFYAATKHAVEALTEALFQETVGFGMRVRLIEPGSFHTRFLERAAAASPPRPEGSAYGSAYPLWDTRKLAVLEEPQDANLVATAILDSLDNPTPFLRIPMGLDGERILALKDAIGADRFSRLAGVRNGGERADEADDVLTPAQLLGGDYSPAALGATQAAYQQGHLDHWLDDPMGAEALAHLTALPLDPS